MQQIVFKRNFSVLFDSIKTENVQYVEEKIQAIKKIVIKKNPEKKLFQISILRYPDQFLKKISSRLIE